jgi:hypothetical protein
MDRYSPPDAAAIKSGTRRQADQGAGTDCGDRNKNNAD